MLKTETCHFCRGNGQAERLEERTINGDWVHNTQLPADIATAWIESDSNAPLRWQETPCPVCGGAGEYDLEFPRCRIF